jgi:preprotein translocase subunit SecG
MNLKLIVFITAVVFIIGSLVLAIWYRMNEDEED